ncbi:signal peptidase 22 kDa subunit [Rhodofomes roseus]|uniref:Signal peptidase subunit 3 n=1 Tax=Rhodofomes roseus TaxID=34475 RepID=A0ABQ8JY06_9APHY|nr:signal peptidase 22 kDa subunit [Rhodofomes roseus]KAH9829121.1 signal peptidase 22 kDa subunit [Rhodofomes roseus]
MHTIFSRVNNVSAFLSSCLMSLVLAVAIASALYHTYQTPPAAGVVVNSIKVLPGKGRYLRKYRSRQQQEFAFVNFNLTADLSPLFHWNTKQLFLYVSAEYTDQQGTANEVVIWDRIVRRKEDANISSTFKNKYHLKDMSTTFRNAPPAHYTLKYNLMPYVGLLAWGEAARTSEPIPFPEPHQLA